jgi:hypothetical protein
LAYNSKQSEYDAAIDCARRILGCDPLREEVHRDLMRLHISAGQPAAALRQYRQCEDLLRHELGVEPAPETRALLSPILGATSVPELLPAAVVGGDLAPLAARIQELSAACSAAQIQLQQAMALLSELTVQLEPADRPVAVRRLRRAVGSEA